MKKTFKRILCALMSFVMVFTILGGSMTSYADTITNVLVSAKYNQTMARSMLDNINSFRTGKDAWYWNEDNKTKTVCNLSKIQYDYDLEQVAMQRAAEIVLSVNHARPDGSAWYTVFDDFGQYTNLAIDIGENLSAGAYNTTVKDNTPANDSFKGWREDDKDYLGQGHRRNMLASKFTCVGIACVNIGNTYYFVAEFGSKATNPAKTTAVDTTKNVKVKVAESMVESCTMTLPNSAINLGVGSTAALTPTTTAQLSLKDYWNPQAKTVKVTVYPSYKSGNTGIAAINGYNVTAKGSGSTTLNVSALGKSGKITFNAVSIPATSITSLTPTAYGFKVDWSKVNETTGYQIQYSTNSDFSGAATIYGGPKNTTSNTITGRACGTKYYVRVRTYITLADGSRVWGDWSPAKAITTTAKPSTTSITSVSGVSCGFKVNWSKISNTTGYQIQYSTRSDFNGGAYVYGGATNTTSNTVTGRARNTKYYVRVRTYKTLADGTRVWGNWTSAVAVTTKK